MIFRGKRHQRGNGIGSVFASLLKRGVAPLLKRGLRYLGGKAVETGVKIGADMSEGRGFREAARERLREAVSGVRNDGEIKYKRLLNEYDDVEQRPAKRTSVKKKIKNAFSMKNGSNEYQKLISGEGLKAFRRTVKKKKTKRGPKKTKNKSVKKKKQKKRKSHKHLTERDLY
jgi:hypothetical protein